ncbi:hypothetical protein EDC61_1015 [Sulfuritortus calidifontis]|uniref:Uncharacterized protein n=1 Tax=Sulfuritortus calidifontis TaxID=1914471 RepID=A0A4R3JYB0_9PROT|nr:hypothetical protein [Sulfuritortus calidifontis]TCS73783.1 hypothetical protein EDC61_1015 [Sulfuritortus calidifontis]
MEFFATAEIRLRASDLQKNVCIANLPHWCASISKVLENQGDKGDIYCVWGEFRVHRELIRDGVRFSLPTCPNGLQWTVTVEGSAPVGQAQIHCTINRREQAPEFIESLEQFVADWKAGLEGGMAQPGGRTAVGECMPWYG